MNIIIEDNIDFYKQLTNFDSDDDEDILTDNVCLITRLPLDKNKITLPCNHSFNFYPLYKEVYNQKMKSPTSHLETNTLKHNQIKCPYCRQIFDFLLPHIRINRSMSFQNGVNSPVDICMPYDHLCTYIFKSGKNKDKICGKLGYYVDDRDSCYCSTHHLTMEKRKITVKKSTTTTNNSSLNDISNNELSSPNKQNHLCNAILVKGKRKGELCNVIINNNSTNFCKRHKKNHETTNIVELSNTINLSS
jgi:hypothetical protein